MPIINLTDLRSELGESVKKRNIGTARLDRWLNMAQDDVSVTLDCGHLIEDDTFATVANTRRYFIEAEFNKVLALIDQTNNRVLEPVTEYDVDTWDPDLDNTGAPFHYSEWGHSWVSAQPTAASVVSISSSVAGDQSLRVRVNGKDANDVERTELLTTDAANGTTVVAGTVTLTRVDQIVKETTTGWTGILTATSNAAAVTLIRISPLSLAREYQPIYLADIPNGAFTIRVRYIRKPRRLVNAQDIPDYPSTYHELVLIGAKFRAHRDLFGFQAAQEILANEWLPMVNRLKRQQTTRSRRSPVIGEILVPDELGQLPSNYGRVVDI